MVLSTICWTAKHNLHFPRESAILRFAGKERVMSFVNELKYDANGLVTVVIQDRELHQ